MIYIVLIIVIFSLEWMIKNHVEKHGDEKVNKPAFHNLILLTKFHNHGAFCGLGQKKSSIVKWVSILLTAVLTVLFVVTLGKCGKNLLKVGLSLMLGGAYSNTYDRIRRDYVVDYFRLNIKCRPIRNLIFNLSDFCIIIGALLLLFSEHH